MQENVLMRMSISGVKALADDPISDRRSALDRAGQV